MAKEKQSITSTGIGESRIFAADPDDPIRREAPIRTVNGLPIPLELAHAIPYENTDQGMAERALGPTAITSGFGDAFDKQIAERRDFRSDESLEIWQAPDPMKEVADAHAVPGMTPRFLSPAKCANEGTRGFEVVKDAKGDPVKLGNMVLGHMPIAKAEQKRKFYRDQGDKALRESLEQFQEQQDQLASAVSGRPAGRRQHSDGEVGLQRETGNSHF